jgi:Uma2 family endonuclease
MTKIVLTYEDFAALPDDGKRYELHEGELSVTPSPGRRHQTILGNLFVLLTLHVRDTGRGDVVVSPFDVILTNITVVEPDIIYVEGSPTLAVEIISPSSRQIDRRRKMALYAAHDVTWYWIVDPDTRTIEAFHLEAGVYRLVAKLEGTESRTLPPFLQLTIDPAAVWR